MERLDSELIAFWEKATQVYQNQMTPEGLSYLHGRGIDMTSVRTFRLGQVVEPLSGHEGMRGRICIPYIKKRAIVALQFRCIQSHDCKESRCPKYLTDGSQWLYGTNDLDIPSPFIGLTEGAFDKIILTQIGIPSIGIPSASAWSGHRWWPELFRGHRLILMFADNDLSEMNPGHKLAMEVKKDLHRSRLVTLDPGMDVTRTYMECGINELYKRAGLEDGYHYRQAA